MSRGMAFLSASFICRLFGSMPTPTCQARNQGAAEEWYSQLRKKLTRAMTIKGSQKKPKSIMGFFLRREKLATEAPKVKCFKRRGKERHVNANTIEVVPQLAI